MLSDSNVRPNIFIMMWHSDTYCLGYPPAFLADSLNSRNVIEAPALR